MTYVVSLLDYTPEPRYDGFPWTRARIEEAPAQNGPWTALVTQTLSPVDSDPANPRTRTFTTSLGTLEHGWYRIVWLDAASNPSVTPAVQNVDDSLAYQPLVEDVALLLWQRTRDPNGNQGAFTGETEPTYEQAAGFVKRATRDIASRMGDTIPAHLVDDAKNVVALRAAMLIELAFFGDQITVSRGPYQELKALYDSALDQLFNARRELGSDGTLGTDDDLSTAGLPAYSFPPLFSPGHAAGSELPWDGTRLVW